MDLQQLLGRLLAGVIQQPGAVPVLIELLRDPQAVQRVVGLLQPPAPAEPDRWWPTAKMATRLRKSHAAFAKMAERNPGLRALARPRPEEVRHGARPRLRWPERAVRRWLRENRPEEIDDGN